MTYSIAQSQQQQQQAPLLPNMNAARRTQSQGDQMPPQFNNNSNAAYDQSNLAQQQQQQFNAPPLNPSRSQSRISTVYSFSPSRVANADLQLNQITQLTMPPPAQQQLQHQLQLQQPQSAAVMSRNATPQTRRSIQSSRASRTATPVTATNQQAMQQYNIASSSGAFPPPPHSGMTRQQSRDNNNAAIQQQPLQSSNPLQRRQSSENGTAIQAASSSHRQHSGASSLQSSTHATPRRMSQTTATTALLPKRDSIDMTTVAAAASANAQQQQHLHNPAQSLTSNFITPPSSSNKAQAQQQQQQHQRVLSSYASQPINSANSNMPMQTQQHRITTPSARLSSQNMRTTTHQVPHRNSIATVISPQIDLHNPPLAHPDSASSDDAIDPHYSATAAMSARRYSQPVNAFQTAATSSPPINQQNTTPAVQPATINRRNVIQLQPLNNNGDEMQQSSYGQSMLQSSDQQPRQLYQRVMSTQSLQAQDLTSTASEFLNPNSQPNSSPRSRSRSGGSNASSSPAPLFGWRRLSPRNMTLSFLSGGGGGGGSSSSSLERQASSTSNTASRSYHQVNERKRKHRQWINRKRVCYQMLARLTRLRLAMLIGSVFLIIFFGIKLVLLRRTMTSASSSLLSAQSSSRLSAVELTSADGAVEPPSTDAYLASYIESPLDDESAAIAAPLLRYDVYTVIRSTVFAKHTLKSVQYNALRSWLTVFDATQLTLYVYDEKDTCTDVHTRLNSAIRCVPLPATCMALSHSTGLTACLFQQRLLTYTDADLSHGGVVTPGGSAFFAPQLLHLYLNDDLLLFDDFGRILRRAAATKASTDNLVLAGAPIVQQNDGSVPEIDFTDQQWADRVRSTVTLAQRQQALQNSEWHVAYVAFKFSSRAALIDRMTSPLPPSALAKFESFLFSEAVHADILTIDTTRAIQVIQQLQVSSASDVHDDASHSTATSATHIDNIASLAPITLQAELHGYNVQFHERRRSKASSKPKVASTNFNMSVFANEHLYVWKNLQSAKLVLQSDGAFARNEYLHLDRLLLENANSDKSIAVLTVNAGYLRLASNWLCWARLIGFKHFLLLAQDHKSFQHFTSQSVPVTMHSLSSVPSTEFLVYGSPDFQRLMTARTSFLLTVLEKGYNFLTVDLDTIWTNNPFQYLYSSERCDLQGQSHKGSKISGGLVSLHSTPHSIRYWRHVVTCAEVNLQFIQLHEAGTYTASKYTEQECLNDIALTLSEQGKLRMCLLDPSLFPDGRGFFTLNAPQRHGIAAPIVLHNNWIVGSQEKIERFQKVRQDSIHQLTFANPLIRRVIICCAHT